jgi:phytoene synthase
MNAVADRKADYCAALVRADDRDRFLATLFAPAECRSDLYALYAFNGQISRVRELAREALPGEIRLQWWHEVIDGQRAEEARANPVAAALLEATVRRQLSRGVLHELLEAHRFDLYSDPMVSLADFEIYAEKISSSVIAMAMQILGVGAEQTQAAARHAGLANVIGFVLRDLPLHASRRQLYMPADILDRHKVAPHEIFAGRSSGGLSDASGELRAIAHRQLAALREGIAALPERAIPALLPLAPLRGALDRIARSDPMAPRDLAPWRRQWLIWRAARKPARIAG